MEHLYSAYTKLVQGQTMYFVKKMMVIPELTGIDDIVIGFGMHADFDKACHIAGIDDAAQRQQILFDLQKAEQTIQPIIIQKQQSKPAPVVSDPVTHWLADQAMVLN